MMNRSILLCFSIFLFFSCNQQEPVSKTSSPSGINFSFDSLIIDQEDYIFNDFYRYFHTIEIEGQEQFWGYNPKTHQLEGYDLTNNQVIGFVPFQRTGPDRITQVYSFYVHNMDSIFVLSVSNLLLLNKNGEVKLNYRINTFNNQQIKGIDFTKNVFCGSTDFMNPIFYCNKKQRLYIPMKSILARENKEYYQQSLFGYLDLKTLEFTKSNTTHPKKHQEFIFPNNKANISFSCDKAIYNFPVSSTVYVYNFENGELQTYSASLELSANESTGIPINRFSGDMGLLQKIFTSNPSFYSLNFDPKQKLYFRWNFAESQEEGRRGNLILSALDENFKLVHEEHLNAYFYRGVFTKKGYLVQSMKNREEGKMKFTLIHLIH